MGHLDNLGNNFRIKISKDENGFLGRECPQNGCEGYFKIKPGTGLVGENLPCYCPYCGFCDGHSSFNTKEQIEYAQSVVFNKVTEALLKDLKGLEFEHKPQGAFGIGLSLKIKGEPHPIYYYREKKLETEVVCEKCTLNYMIYGVFGFCPDCGNHNSIIILRKNLELIEKILAFAGNDKSELAQMLIADALENCISAFDGFGRKTCGVFALKSTEVSKAENISFQNIEEARKKVVNLFNVDFAGKLNSHEWDLLVLCFQKRHLLAHKMGVVDQEYLNKTNDKVSVLGRKSKLKYLRFVL